MSEFVICNGGVQTVQSAECREKQTLPNATQPLTGGWFTKTYVYVLAKQPISGLWWAFFELLWRAHGKPSSRFGLFLFMQLLTFLGNVLCSVVPLVCFLSRLIKKIKIKISKKKSKENYQSSNTISVTKHPW